MKKLSVQASSFHTSLRQAAFQASTYFSLVVLVRSPTISHVTISGGK
ncbi:hypothetical protein [Fortiea contorta]|nr:hypothetical protein [Fortiea contorta]